MNGQHGARAPARGRCLALEEGRHAERATLNRRYGGHARYRLTAFLLDNVTNVEELTPDDFRFTVAADQRVRGSAQRLS
jgi:hypothetical protein